MAQRLMRAARFYGPGVTVRVENVPYPTPGPAEVLVRIAACGICGSDIHFLEGMPVPAPLPITLGHEPAGVVEAVGSGVAAWHPGDRVAFHLGNGCGTCRTCQAGRPNCCSEQAVLGIHVDGAFAEAVKVTPASLLRVPESVSLAAAAVATDSVATPYHALTCRAGLRPGEKVLVIGAGGVGGHAVKLASVLGAEQVVAADISAVALERARKLGATAVVPVVAGTDAADEIRERTAGGVDVALECVGAPDTVALGARALAAGGRLVTVGVGMAPPQIDVPQVLFCLSELTVLGTFGSHREDLEAVLRMEAEGKIDIGACISHRVSIEDVPAGLDMLQAKKGSPQRIVVQMPA